MTEREIFKKFSKLSEDKVNTMSNKIVYVKNTIMTNIIMNCKGEKKRYKSTIWIQKKINDSRL